jgi:uncharacterized membrane protein
MSHDKLLSLELRISLLLRWGVLLAGAFMLIGWASMLDFTQNPLAAFQDYKSESLHESLLNALTQNQWGLLIAYAGLTILISLPLLRVLMTAVLFVKQKETVLAAIAFFVFATLILSFSLGIEL